MSTKAECPNCGSDGRLKAEGDQVLFGCGCGYWLETNLDGGQIGDAPLLIPFAAEVEFSTEWHQACKRMVATLANDRARIRKAQTDRWHNYFKATAKRLRNRKVPTHIPKRHQIMRLGFHQDWQYRCKLMLKGLRTDIQKEIGNPWKWKLTAMAKSLRSRECA
jgi:hypothetical protein